jgi:hypothetical protein
MSSFLIVRKSSIQVLRCSGNKIVLDNPLAVILPGSEITIAFESKQLGEDKIMILTASSKELIEKVPVDGTSLYC